MSNSIVLFDFIIVFVNSLWLFIHVNLFAVGFVNIILSKNKNLLVVLMSIEIMLLGIGLGFVGYSVTLVDFQGQVFALLLLMISAAESAVGLGLIIASFKSRGTIAVSDLNSLKH
jgi:NADH-quinone oxidoreductase subunit K